MSCGDPDRHFVDGTRLGRELAKLAAENPDVAAAADEYDRVRDEIVEAAKTNPQTESKHKPWCRYSTDIAEGSNPDSDWCTCVRDEPTRVPQTESEQTLPERLEMRTFAMHDDPNVPIMREAARLLRNYEAALWHLSTLHTHDPSCYGNYNEPTTPSCGMVELRIGHAVIVAQRVLSHESEQT